MNTKPNDCAYPADSQTQTEGGLTKREYFAAMAMQGLCTNPILKDVIDKVKSAKEFDSYTANTAVSLADSLINALNQSND